MNTPSPHPRLWRTLLGPALACGAAAAGWWRWRTPLGLCILVVAAASLVLAVAAPRAWAPVQAGLERFGRGVAAVFTVFVLGLVFVLVFVPGRLLLALLRRDPLHRAPEPARESYWEPLPPAGGADRFRRPY